MTTDLTTSKPLNGDQAVTKPMGEAVGGGRRGREVIGHKKGIHKVNRPNYIIDIPAEEYHQATKAGKYLSSHRLNSFRKCPLEYYKRLTGEIVDGDTQAFVIGRATHTLVLEGDEKFRAEYVVGDGPINEKTGKPYGAETAKFREWVASQSKPVIRSADEELMAKMRAAVRKHETAAALLADGFAEGTVRAAWNGVPVQSRMDWFNPATGDLVDLKTCADIDRFRFDVRDHGYIFQLAYYAKVLKLAGWQGPIKCWLIAVEKREPYRVAVVRISEATISDANEGHIVGEGCRDDNDAMIAELKRCRESCVWPTRYEQVITI